MVLLVGVNRLTLVYILYRGGRHRTTWRDNIANIADNVKKIKLSKEYVCKSDILKTIQPKHVLKHGR